MVTCESINGLDLFVNKLFCKPTTKWLIVEFKTRIRNCDAQRNNHSCYSDAFVKRVILLLDKPRVEQIHNRVVYDVERIRQITEEFVDTHS